MLLYELKTDLNSYLATRGSTAAASTLKDLIAFNERERAREMPYFGQELFIRAETKGPLTSPEYRAAATLCRRLAREEGIDAVMTMHKLDAMVVPTVGPAWPTDLVKAITSRRQVHSPRRRRLSEHHGPGRLGRRAAGRGPLHGARVERSRLISLAFAYEQASRQRKPPKFLPTIPLN